MRQGADLLVGTALDVSDGGMFFRPEAGVLQGCFTQLEDDTGWPGVGTELTVRMQLDAVGADWQQHAATIRWCGMSQDHRCLGMGLQIHR